MRKKFTFFVVLSIFFLWALMPIYSSAETITTGVVTADLNLRVRSGPGTNYDQVGWAVYNTNVTILSYANSGNGCDDKWAKIITYDNVEGYACSTYIGNITTVEAPKVPENDMSKMTDEEFDKYLTSQGFPDSYKVKLKELHKLHPTWIFVGVKTKYNWANALSIQSEAGRNSYQVTSGNTAAQGYLSTDDAHYNFYTDTFKTIEGKSWYQANSQTIGYYLDPRNFLNEESIFMFEKLGYNPSLQTSQIVKSILYTDYYNDLIQYFMEAAQKYGVSPVYLASKVRQEVGINGGVATNGKAGDYCGINGLNGYYNFYAIGANDGVCTGMKKAKELQWNTKQKAIVDGASWIVDGYISAKQDTTYFQKFNTSIFSTKAIWHQYATDVQYAAHTAKTTKNSYKSTGIIDNAFVFDIPIYDGIVSSTSLPKTGNPNNYLKTLKINGAGVTNFDGANTSYKITVPYNIESVKVEATTVNSNAKISGLPTDKIVKLTNSNTNISITVTAQNGNIKTYTISVTKEPAPVTPPVQVNPSTPDTEKDNSKPDNENNNEKQDDKTEPGIVYLTPDETVTKAGFKIKKTNYMSNFTLGSTVESTIKKLQDINPYASINIVNKNNSAKTSGSIVTGDKVTINSNGNNKTYTVIIYGDLNGDGEITVIDLGKLQKHLLKTSVLTGAYLEAADTDKNGSISVVDLGKVQKHLLKTSNISQS